VAWVPQTDFPFKFWVAPRADCEETVVNDRPDPENYCQELAQAGHDAWRDQAGCAGLSNQYQGESINCGFTTDYENHISFNDPGADCDITTRDDDDTTDPGVLAVTLPVPNNSEQLFVFEGVVYKHIIDADIVVENDVLFASPEDCAQGGSDILGVMTHEIGHSYGMGHSCEENDPCQDPDLQDATMYWTAPPAGDCTRSDDLNTDDIQGITALYGPSASFTCDHELSESLATGVVPFDLSCSIVSDYRDEIDDVTWAWGDGPEVSKDLDATHTYTTSGNFTVAVEVHGNRDSCGEEGWTNTFRKVGFVRACTAPVPEFSIDHVDGLVYQMLNESDVSVYGCYTDIQWQVFQGANTTGKELTDLAYQGWEPKITFPDEGTYTVVLNLGGPGGNSAAKITFDVKDYRGQGYAACDSSASGASALAFVGLAGLLLRRRARKS
jgi:hypothetical protein